MKIILINQILWETVKILVNKLKMIKMRMIGQVKKRIQKKRKKARNKRKEIMKIKTL
jgi:hypothetical protein